MNGERFHSSYGAMLFTLRCMICVVGFNTAGHAFARDSDLLTEAKAVEYALTRTAIQGAEDARLLAAESAVTQSTTLPNPVASMTHENVDAPAGRASESTVTISQTFDISGRRQLRREAAETRRQATRLDNQSRRIAIVQDVRKSFAAALYQQELQASHVAWLKRLDAVTNIVGQLARAGEASGYDRRRLEREAQTAKVRLRVIQAEASRRREILSGTMAKPIADASMFEGNLIPDSPLPIETLLAGSSKHPEIAGLEAQVTASERDRQVAELLQRPDITLGLGTKHVSEPGFSDNGLILALSVPIPVFDKGKAQEQQAHAQVLALQSELSLKHSRVQAELRGIWSQTTQLRQAALEYQDETLITAQELSRIAEASYRAGEGTLLELLDAYRAELEAQTLKLDLALQARLSRIELDALTGATPYE